MKIIINADDFGANIQINDAIYKSAKKGYITSSTILVAGDSIDNAIFLAEKMPKISFGIHLALTGEFISLSSNKKLKDCIWNYRGINIFYLPKIINEFSLQIEKLQNKGINITHVDTHHHIHRFPLVLLAVIHVSKKYKINKIRSEKILINKSIFNCLYRYFHSKLVDLMGVKQCDCYSNFEDFYNNINFLKKGDKKIEIMCHPGSKYNDEYYFKEDFFNLFKDSLINYNDI